MPHNTVIRKTPGRYASFGGPRFEESTEPAPGRIRRVSRLSHELAGVMRAYMDSAARGASDVEQDDIRCATKAALLITLQCSG